jgi:chromate reductase
MRILAISGSLRKGSTNTALLLAARAVAPKSVEIELWDGLSELPYFNPDLDVDAPPAPVAQFREKLACSDALIISTPEYAHGIPGALKNALDWLVSDPRFEGKPVGLFYCSASDATFAQQSLEEILRTMSARVVSEARINVPGAKSKITAEGKILDEAVAGELARVVGELMKSVES